MLSHAIETRDPAEAVLCSGGGKVLTATEVSRAARVVRGAVAVGTGAVALAFKNNIDAALAIIALDGFADELLLVPQDASPETTTEFIARTKCKLLVGDSTTAIRPDGCAVLKLDLNAPPTASRDQAAPKTTRWILPTSGTTGTPKLVGHTLGTLARSVRRDSSRGRELRWGCLYHLSRFAGIQVFLQAVLGGSRLIFTDRLSPMTEQVEGLVGHQCNALSATPTLWRKLLMTPGFHRLSFRQITLGGEIVDAAILDALRLQFPKSRIVHIYASTEAGVGFSVNDNKPGFPVSLLSGVGSGVELKISADGILMIKPRESRQRYVGSDERLVEANGFINTGDRVEIVGDRVVFRGRANGSINVGGNKVMPEEVEGVLLSHADVLFARVRPRPSSIMGNLVEASVVVKPGCKPGSEFVRDLRQFCRQRLPHHKVPAFIDVVPALELSAAGKLKRD